MERYRPPLPPLLRGGGKSHSRNRISQFGVMKLPLWRGLALHVFESKRYMDHCVLQCHKPIRTVKPSIDNYRPWLAFSTLDVPVHHVKRYARGKEEYLLRLSLKLNSISSEPIHHN